MSNLMSHYIGQDISIPVTFKFDVHKLYNKYSDSVRKIRDVVEGGVAVKAAGVKYLPKLSLQKDADYEAYKKRALFFNSTAKILNTNVGTIVRRSPTLKYNDEMKPYFEDDTASFLSFRELLKYNARELCSVSRAGTLIEVDTVRNIPIPVRVDTEQIINWSVNGDGVITDVLIAQVETTLDTVSFKSEDNIYYYHLYMKDGVYRQRKYDENKGVVSDKAPAINGKTLDEIPFSCVTSFGASMDPIRPTLLDVAEVNLSHYCTSADLEGGRHYVGLPQPVITGGKSEQPLHVGSDKAWVIPNDKAKAFYLEFLGQGLEGLARALQEKESQMSQFSAQLMDTGSKGSEAEGTVRLRYSSDAANISDIAESIEIGLKLTYGFISKWLQTDTPEIALNKDFLADKMGYNELRELSKALMDGSITEDEFRFNLKRGEIIPH